MSSLKHRAEDLERLIKRSNWVGYFAWAVAIIVMIYGTPIVYGFLVGTHVPTEVAWLLSLAADFALVVGLIATPVLAELNQPAGWVGTLRWVAGFITWALQTAGSWTAKNGPYMVGVLSHSAGPILLFFAVEAASSFQRKVASALAEKTRQLESAEQRDADVRAERAEIDAKLRSTAAELTAARSQVASLTDRLTSIAETTDADKAAATLTAERYEARITALIAEHDEAVKRLKEKHREALTATRPGKGAVSLSAYRASRTEKPGGKPTGKAELTDEEAVQMMLAAHDDPDHDWSKNSVRTLTGVGVGRAEKLIGLWLTAATEKATGKAVNQ